MWHYLFACVLGMSLLIPAAAQDEANSNTSPDGPVANPGRPTVSTPATLTPVGYVQFESGMLSAWTSPDFSSQTSINEVIKFAPVRRIELLVGAEPFAHSRVAGQSSNDAGGVLVGIQGVLYSGEGAKPTVSASYLHNVFGGTAPDLDIGSATNSLLLLASADVHKFHYDANLFFNEVVAGPIRRGQFGQSLSVSRLLAAKFTFSGEIWHFSQPFLRGNAIGNLWAVSYAARPTLIFDGGFNHGFTRTSTDWEVFAGFTYLLPHKIIRH